jgi:hypothetical protein
MDNNDLFSLVREAEANFVYGNVRIGKYVNWSMHDTLDRIDAYLNSQQTNGKFDSLGREKPFFNICSAVCNVWYRATDIDRKDIRIYTDTVEDTALAFVANVLLHNWMDEERFGVFLNLWGRSLARYGSSIVKFVRQDSRLIPSVIPWNRLIVDPVDFSALPVIEKIYKTPAQLKRMTGYNQDVVDSLLEAHAIRETLDKQTIDNKDEFIEIYEVHGELSQATYNDSKGLEVKDNDNDIYFQQMHVISFVQTNDGDYKDFTLYSGKEAKSPYMLTHLIEEDGRTLSIGAVEYLFDAQWMMNHTMKQQKDYLDLASRMIFQSSDPNFSGKNLLASIETGVILTHAQNQPLTLVNNSTMNMNAIIEFGTQWKNLVSDLTSTPDAFRGNPLPSGTPYSSIALQASQAGSLFELMTENKGLAVEDMVREFVLPFQKTKMDNSDEISAILDSRGIAEIDAMYVPREAIKRYNKEAVDEVIRSKGESIISPYDKQQGQAQVSQQLAELGNRRHFKPSEISTKTWKTLLKDFEARVKVECTNENNDKNAVLQTLSTVFQTIAGNPMILQDSNAKMVFNKILNTTGTISPIELSTKSNSVAPVNGGMVGAGNLPVMTK